MKVVVQQECVCVCVWVGVWICPYGTCAHKLGRNLLVDKQVSLSFVIQLTVR